MACYRAEPAYCYLCFGEFGYEITYSFRLSIPSSIGIAHCAGGGTGYRSSGLHCAAARADPGYSGYRDRPSTGASGFRAYRYSGTHLHALSNCHAIPDADHGADGYAVSHRNAAAHAGCVANPHALPDSDAVPHLHPGAYGNSETNLYTISNSHSYSQADFYAQADHGPCGYSCPLDQISP